METVVPASSALFAQPLEELFVRRERALHDELAAVAPDDLPVLHPDQYLGFLRARHLVTPLVLEGAPRVRRWLASREERDGGMIRRREMLTLEVPFRGDPELFHHRLAGSYPAPLAAKIDADRSALVLEVSLPDRSVDGARRAVETALEPIRKGTIALAPEAVRRNAGLSEKIREEFERLRRDRLEQRGLMAELGLDLAGLPDPARAERFPAAPTPIELATTTAGGREAGTGLSDASAEAILQTLGQMSGVMERCPRAFATLDEEDLCTHLRVHLNGHLRVAATGEPFGVHGKTGIRLPGMGRELWIAECRFWPGGAERQFHATLDRLWGQLAGPGTRAALLWWVRDAAVGVVRERIAVLLKEHPGFEELAPGACPEECRARFHRPGDRAAVYEIAVRCCQVPGAGPDSP